MQVMRYFASLSIFCVLLCLLIQLLPTDCLQIMQGSITKSPKLHTLGKQIHLLLGSGSFSRKLILQEQGIDFQVVKAGIDEKAIGDRSSAVHAQELVQLLAHAKADAILHTLPLDHFQDPHAVLLTADQVVVSGSSRLSLENHIILEKPETIPVAKNYIGLYNGKCCSTIGSIALTHLATKKRVIGVDSAVIHFKRIPEEVIESIMKESGDLVVQCAGGLMVEHPLLEPYLDHIDGTVDSVMGLSIPLLEKLFEDLNI